MKAAFDQTSQHLWQVDLAKKLFTIYDESKKEGKERTILSFPDELIEKGLIHANSASHFRAFAEEILSGRTEGSANFIIRYSESGCYGWATLSYRIMYDDVGHAVRA